MCRDLISLPLPASASWTQPAESRGSVEWLLLGPGVGPVMLDVGKKHGTEQPELEGTHQAPSSPTPGSTNDDEMLALIQQCKDGGRIVPGTLVLSRTDRARRQEHPSNLRNYPRCYLQPKPGRSPCTHSLVASALLEMPLPAWLSLGQAFRPPDLSSYQTFLLQS